ncbi:hypothetical protein PVK06_034548 [Gossypium arboreum]|uniref:Uncharacterized protein n=1 Tax=Gossypium arboreum TaxID=29729 RepID=A0ABR0NEH3_GOSAR|nr:hypothetical protein PVK06_034548 [Gossypium arboreum]
MVHGLKFRASWCNDPKLLKKRMFDYFSNYFSCTSRKWVVDMELKFKEILKEDATKLELLFMVEETKEVIWSCDESKAPRPDMFNMCIIKGCYQLVREDLSGVVLEWLLNRNARPWSLWNLFIGIDRCIN